MATININLTIAGDTVSAVSVVALTRSDTGAAPAGVSLPIALTLTGGAWVGSFTDASPPAYYALTAAATYSDATVQTLPTFNLGSGTVSAGTYGDISDIYAEMGEFNTQQAADPDNAQSAATIALHEQKAIAFADAYINSQLSANGMATPATSNLAILRVIFGKLGAWQLYQVRGLSDKKNAFQEKYDWSRMELDELIFMNRGGFARAAGYSDAPVAVAASVDPDGNTMNTTWPRVYWDGFVWRY